MSARSVAAAIHGALVAAANCEKSGNIEWRGLWEGYTAYLARNCLPSGGGVDRGTRVTGLTPDGRGFMLTLDFHHMNGDGYYDGWTAHKVTVYPSFNGVDLTRITGANQNNVKEYLSDILWESLNSEAPSVQPTQTQEPGK